MYWWAFRATLLTAISSFFFGGASAPPQVASPPAVAAQTRALYGPYWTTRDGLDTVLLLNNPTLDPMAATLVAYSERGRELARREFTLDPVGSLSLRLSEVAPTAGSGRLTLYVPVNIPMPAAQAVVSNGGDGWVIDFEDERNLASANRRVLGLLPSPESLGLPGARVKSFCVVTNVDDEAIQGAILVGAEGRTQRKSFRLGPGESRSLNLAPGFQKGEAARLVVETDQPSRGLLVTGYTLLPDGSPMPLHFSDGGGALGGELASFFTGVESKLFLGNDSSEATDVSVTALTFDGLTRGGVARVPPDGVAVLNLRDLLGLEPASSGTVVVSTPEGARVHAAIYNRSAEGRFDSSALKDTLDETNVAYILGVRLGEHFTSKLYVFNPNDFQVELCLFLYFGDVRYTYPLKKLEARQGAMVDLLKARDEGLPGDGGGLIPPDAESGQAQIVMHKEGESKNLLVLGRYQDLLGGAGATFQGCFTCPATLHFIDLLPDSFSGEAGGSDSFQVLAFFTDGSFKVVTNSPSTSKFTLNSSVATAGFTLVNYVGAGFTELVAEYNGCDQYGSELGSRGRLQCICDLPGFASDFSGVQVQPPTISSISPERIPLGMTTEVTITGTGFAAGAQVQVAGSGVTATVKTRTLTQITADLAVTGNPATGARAVTVVVNGLASNGENITLPTPDHMVVVSDTGGNVASCTTTVGRQMRFRVVDSDGVAVGLIPVREVFNSITMNTCGNGQPAASGCANTDNAQSEFTDSITVNCNSVGGSCGYDINWTWQWCGPSNSFTSVGTLNGTVHNDAVTVNGKTMPPFSNQHPAGTVINP